MSLPAVCPYIYLNFKNYLTYFDAVFLIDRVFQKERFSICNLYNIIQKHFSIRFATVQSHGVSLVRYKC
jgi:hypothetical protein